MIEEEMWGRYGPEYVDEGDVYTHDGRPLHLRTLIMRRWGWPKLAAKKAASYLREQHQGPVRLYIQRPGRDRQQAEIREAIPEVLDDLMEGIANRGQREVGSSGRLLSSLVLQFEDGQQMKQITDDGMTTGVLHVVANRLGCSLDELRENTAFVDEGTCVRVVVNASRFEG